MHVTLRDVARLAGVSAKTVSRVVNHQGEISDSTRQRVQQAIDQSGYRPNFFARSLVSQHSHTLAVVASSLDLYGPSHTLTGIEQQSYEMGYSLLFSLLPTPDKNNVAPILDSLIFRRVDGIIWAVPEMGDNRAWLQSEMLRHLPPIVFLTMQPRPGFASAASDNRSGAALAARHLIDQGRRHIGLISGPPDWWESRERQAGFITALRDGGLEAAPNQVVAGDWSAASGSRCLQQLLAQVPALDAVFAANDQMALGAMGAAHRLGKRIPQDIAYVGFDNTPEAAFFWPPLSSVEQHLCAQGAAAVQMLQVMIEAQQSGLEIQPLENRILAVELCIRESSAGLQPDAVVNNSG